MLNFRNIINYVDEWHGRDATLRVLANYYVRGGLKTSTKNKIFTFLSQNRSEHLIVESQECARKKSYPEFYLYKTRRVFSEKKPNYPQFLDFSYIEDAYLIIINAITIAIYCKELDA